MSALLSLAMQAARLIGAPRMVRRKPDGGATEEGAEEPPRKS